MEDERATIKKCVDRLLKIVSELEEILQIIDEQVKEKNEEGDYHFSITISNSSADTPDYEAIRRASAIYGYKFDNYDSPSTYSVGVGKENPYE
ncbi:MAG: hypothetical protein GX452_13805 [Ignavibacteriales bacterium]|nr:hypothetical protein [Ignavibacteriales bacterium]